MSGAADPDVGIETLGEDALLLRLGNGIDAATNRRVHALAATLQAQRPAWLREIVPAYATLAVRIDASELANEDDPLRRAQAWLRAQAHAASGSATADAAPALAIPVCYGGAHGPDLEDVARHVGLDADAVVARHAAGDYRVAMLGFAPGFPYLLGLDPTLATPRLATPRTRVAAGSVGIGGAQTGIYPREGPGGWRIVGRTPLTLFDAAHDPPCLLRPGQALRFFAIDAPEFARLSGRGGVRK